MKKFIAIILCGVLALMSNSAFAADYTLTIKDHKFDPPELAVPAGQKIKLTVKNLDPTPAEFESYDLNREKIIKGGAEAVVTIGPLDAGTYKFFDEFHEDTATGIIRAE
jgi:hypothetical protein